MHTLTHNVDDVVDHSLLVAIKKLLQLRDESVGGQAAGRKQGQDFVTDLSPELRWG